MFRATLMNGDDLETIHNETTSSLKVVDDTLVEGTEGIDTYSFSLNMDNPGYNILYPFKTLIQIVNTEKNKVVFDGFIKRYSATMTSEGVYKRNVIAYQGIGLLKQTKQLYGEYHDLTPKEFLQVMIDEHNRQTDGWKKFYLGEVTVTNSTDNVYRFLDEESNTYDAIYEKLINRLGGELKARLTDGKWYLDWKTAFGETSQTEIRVGKNLKDAERDLGTDNVATRFFIYGADFEIGIIDRFENTDDGQKAVVEFGENMRDILKSELPSGSTVGSYILYRDDAILLGNENSKPYLTIGEVNNGKDYIDDPVAFSQFGTVVESVKFDDVMNKANLKNKGQAYVNSYNQVTDSNQITALDLSLINQDIDSFEVYNYYPYNNPGIAEKNLVRVIEKRTSLSNPQNASLTIGDKFIKASKYQSNMNKTSKAVEEVRKTVTNQNMRISKVSSTVLSVSNEVKTINTAIQSINTKIGDADIPGLQVAINNLNAVVDVLNQSIGDIPNYGLATITDSGLMSSLDKVKLDGIQLATGTKDGLLVKEDKQKLNRITANQAIDLDQFKADFLTLKAIVDGMAVE